MSAKQNKIFLKNTLSGNKDEFVPISPGVVKIYTCGPTVYDEAHIGNLRAYVFSDTLHRMLAYNGYNVSRVINITDVGHLTNDEELGDSGEDKMEKNAKKQGTTAQEIAKRITKLFFKDLVDLNINIKEISFPRATQYITEQIMLTKTLEEKGYTYRTSDGIYFDTSAFAEYGKLGNINIEGLKEGARIEKNSERKNLTDFALWKFSKEGDNRQQEWDSPWGVGFPGWHIECSAMSRALLGAHIDIHTGGVDHIPIHHNNEIAQSECASGKKFVNYWMHGAHMMIEGKKISKSLGNTILLRQLIDRRFAPSVYKYWLFTGHYSTQLNFTWDALESSKKAFIKLSAFISGAKDDGKIIKNYQEEFNKFINDDLDMPQALALVWKLLKDDSISKKDAKATILDFNKVFGFDFVKIQNNLIKISELPKEVQELLKERKKARIERDWSASDAFREKISKLGFEVKDSDSGTGVFKK